jgi:hypothetical protein
VTEQRYGRFGRRALTRILPIVTAVASKLREEVPEKEPFYEESRLF